MMGSNTSVLYPSLEVNGWHRHYNYTQHKRETECTRGTPNEIYTDKMKHNENVKSHEKSHITKSFLINSHCT